MTAHDRLQQSTSLAVACFISGVAFVLLAWCLWAASFFAAFLMTLANVAFGLAAIPAVYDAYQRDRRQKLWASVRRQASRQLAARVSLIVSELHWHLCRTYTSYGSYLREAESDPTPEAEQALDRKVSDLVHFAERFDGTFHRLIQIPALAPQERDASIVLDALSAVIQPTRREELRAEIAPMTPLAEDASKLFLAVEQALATAWWAMEHGKASRADEHIEDRFLPLFTAFVLQLRVLFKRCAEEWRLASSGEA